MPGIADAPVTPLQLGAGSAAQINENTVSGVGDFMSAFRDGFITVDDITKRTQDKPLENAQRQQALADTNIIRPKQRAVAAKGLDIQSDSLDVQAQAQPKLDSASLSQAETILATAQRGNDRNAILNFYQTVTAPGQLPPKLDPNDPESDYDYAKIESGNRTFLTKQRELQSATALGKFVKSFTVKERSATGGETESVQRVNEMTGEKLGEPTKIGESAPQVDIFRKEYNALPEVHDFRKVDAAYNKLNAGLDDANPTPLRDQAAIFSWMKILDPTSTVREGEYATVEKTRSWPEQIRALYNKAQSGQILTVEQRTQMKEAAVPLYEGQLQSLAPQLDRYMTMEEEMKMPGGIVPKADSDLLRRIRAKKSSPAATVSSVSTTDAPVKVNSPSEAPTTAKFIQAPNGKVYKNPGYVGTP